MMLGQGSCFPSKPSEGTVPVLQQDASVYYNGELSEDYALLIWDT
jgi:hypothetical protein